MQKVLDAKYQLPRLPTSRLEQNLQLAGREWGRAGREGGAGSWQQRLEPPHRPWRPVMVEKEDSWKSHLHLHNWLPVLMWPQTLRGLVPKDGVDSTTLLFTFVSNISRQFLLGWCHADHLEGPSNCIYSNLITAGRASEDRVYKDLYYRCRWQSFNWLNQQKNGKNKVTPEFGSHFMDSHLPCPPPF